MEIEFYNSLTNQKQIVYISKQFAAKEAIAKAIGTGIRNDTHFKNIEILRDKNGALFDGVPRTIGQAEQLADMKINFTHVIEIFVEDEIIVKRMSGRRVHPASGRNYHIDHNPPKNDGLEDETGESLVQREDDKPDTVLKRLDVYHEQTKPLTTFYKGKSDSGLLKFIKVDGSYSVDEVFAAISSQI